jgi:MFS transporter, DHA1 family, tetracycline resistance protein
VNLLFITFMLPETRIVPKERAKSFTFLKGIYNVAAAFNDVDARPVYLSSFLYMSGFSFLTSFMGVLLVTKFGFDESGVGTFFGAVGAWVVVTQLFLLRLLTSHYSERQILRYALLVVAGGMAAYPFLTAGPQVFLVMPFVAVPQGLAMANLQSLVSKSVSAEKQGAALGINGSLLAFAQGAIPLIAGVGSGLVGIAGPFIVGSLFVIAAWATLFIFQKR